MDQNNNLEKVLTILKEQGATEKEIAQFLAELTKVGFGNLYSQAALLFTNEDLKEIEETQGDEASNNKIKEIYLKHTGKNPQQEMDKFIDTFCEGFLREYEKDKAISPILK